MIWLLALAALVLIGVAIFASLPLKVPREQDREGLQNAEASTAYDRVSRWPIFAVEHYIVMRALAPHTPEGLLLDIGCGPGYLAATISHRFPDLKVTGVDISPDMVSIAKGNWSNQAAGHLDFVQGDAAALPFPDCSVNLVVSSLSLHHWKEPAKAFQEIYRVMAPGGRLLLFDLRRDSPRLLFYAFTVGQAIFAPQAIRRTNGAVGSIWASYTATELEQMLSSVPLEKLEVRSRPGWLLVSAVKSRR